MNYQETLDYIYHKLPMYSRMGSAAFKKDLTNIRLLCDHLGNPQQSFKSIHVGGTNGKGSVSHMLASIFQATGYKTGLYTSPHLYDFRERIRINGEMIPENVVTRFVQSQKALIEEIEPSFFEITVAMAFAYFAAEKIDIAIVEVGLGGRLDSTNIITPELSIITNIGWDHMNMLGNSLPQIAGEKAGIIKENIPAVIGRADAETRPVFENTAAQKSSPLYFAESQYKEEFHALNDTSLLVQYRKEDNSFIRVETDLQGIYQVENIRTVLSAIDVLRNQAWNLPQEKVMQALQAVKKRTGLGGRWEVLQQTPTVVLEVAHNEDGMQKMLQHVGELSYEKLHIVMGMVKDKEVEKVLQLLPRSAHYYFTQAHIPRALPAEVLQTKAASLNLQGAAFSNVNEALHAAKQAAGENDLILVCGSIFLVAEVSKA
ncbi:MAG TPA: folylpolyglutamate synthase/dihydrofolate synthase family protein [Flavisolibacter sp.]|jgi:dihydrofolate synthase/folylpolyglutamate synthase|nr:folylpolyglutamate synthase/dihydrofolate synthase family protein [Flavisolibacter sp.]